MAIVANILERESVLAAVRRMNYGQAFDILLSTAWEIFPPPPKPTLGDVLGLALSVAEPSQVAEAFPDTPADPVEVLRRILGDDYRVASLRKAHQEIVTIYLLATDCPWCRGTGWRLSTVPQEVSEMDTDEQRYISRQSSVRCLHERV